MVGLYGNGATGMLLRITAVAGFFITSLLVIENSFGAEGNNVVNITLSSSVVLGLPLDLAVDFKTGENLTLGITGSSTRFDFLGEEWNSIGYGFRAFWHFHGALMDGWFLGPTIKKIDMNITDTGFLFKKETTYGDTSIISYEVLGGYLWMWSSFNHSLAISYGALSGSEIEMSDGSTKRVSKFVATSDVWLHLNFA